MRGSQFTMNKLSILPDEIRRARPDSITDLGQLVAGSAVIHFDTYNDLNGIINSHLSRLALVTGPAYRLIDGQIIEESAGRGKHMRAERLPTYTRDRAFYDSSYKNTPLLRVEGFAIKGIDTVSPAAGLSRGLLAVQQGQSKPTAPYLAVGPDLYVDGENTYQKLFVENFMAIALDSDSRLARQSLH